MSVYERQVLAAGRAVIDAHAAHLWGVGNRLLLALAIDDLDEVRFIANDLVGYGEQDAVGRFNNAIGNLGSDE